MIILDHLIRSYDVYAHSIKTDTPLPITQQVAHNAWLLRHLLPCAKPALPRWDVTEQEVGRFSECAAYLLRPDFIRDKETYEYRQFIVGTSSPCVYPCLIGELSYPRLARDPSVIDKGFSLEREGLDQELSHVKGAFLEALCYPAYDLGLVKKISDSSPGNFAHVLKLADVLAYVCDPFEVMCYSYTKAELDAHEKYHKQRREKEINSSNN
jgi:hypothetical protein